MKIYIAAPWKHKEEARNVAAFLEDQGHVIVSRWLTQHEDTTDPQKLQDEAIHDLEDVQACQVFILLNLCASEGKATELGMAYILNKPIILVGPKTGNIFYNLPGIYALTDIEDLTATLQ